MQWFYNLKIAHKLLLSFIAVLMLTASMGAFSITQLARVNQAAIDISTNWLPSMRTALQMKATLARMRVAELQGMQSDSADDSALFAQTRATQLKQFQEHGRIYTALISTPEEHTMQARLHADFDAYLMAHKKVMALAGDNLMTQARQLMRVDSAQLYQRMNAQLDQMSRLNEGGSSKAVTAAAAIYDSARIWITALLSGGIVLGLLLALGLARVVSRPLRAAVAFARRVAEGDLTAQIKADSTDETGQLVLALRAMNERFFHVVAQVRGGSDMIKSASAEIASANQDLSDRSLQQASALEQTAAAVEQLSVTVSQNANHAGRANQLAQSASLVARQGGSVVGQVVATMGTIQQASKQIVDIIGVINGIAFQTNILALNAAVEAAHAGEQGRGFAVVAAEVRVLAQRSTEAAREIKTLIQHSVAAVNNGNQLVTQAGITMDQVVVSVGRVTAIVGEISVASRVQSIGVEQVSRALTQIDQATRRNTALVAQAAITTRSLRAQAMALSRLVGWFKLRDGVWVPQRGRPAQDVRRDEEPEVAVTAERFPSIRS